MKSIWNKWKVVAAKIGNFQASVIFSLLYFVLVSTTAIVVNIFNDFLRLKKAPSWQKTDIKMNDLEDFKRQ